MAGQFSELTPIFYISLIWFCFTRHKISNTFKWNPQSLTIFLQSHKSCHPSAASNDCPPNTKKKSNEIIPLEISENEMNRHGNSMAQMRIWDWKKLIRSSEYLSMTTHVRNWQSSTEQWLNAHSLWQYRSIDGAKLKFRQWNVHWKKKTSAAPTNPIDSSLRVNNSNRNRKWNPFGCVLN